jgi:hypothetical protein
MEGGLSVRVLKALREVLHGKISTSLDEMPDTALVAAHISLIDLARLPNCGKGSVEEVRRWAQRSALATKGQTVGERNPAELERRIRDLTSDLLETFRMVAWILDDSTDAELRACKELVKRTLAELGPH